MKSRFVVMIVRHLPLAALGGLTIEVDHINGIEPENSGDVIHADDDSNFSAYGDNAEDSDSCYVEV